VKPTTSETLVNTANARALRRVVGRVDIPSRLPERPDCVSVRAEPGPCRIPQIVARSGLGFVTVPPNKAGYTQAM
jgi:hypothetical protein